MAKSRGLPFDVTGPARRDISIILKRSIRDFGTEAALRYRALIRQALLDIEWNHVSLSRDRVTGARVKEPRRFILYRQRPDGVVEVARILHDSCDLARHLPTGYVQRFD